MYKKIASNTIAQILSKAITAFISIFLIGILTKYLPIELYGSYNKIYSYLGIFAFLADLGLYTIAVREISKAQANTQKIIGNILSLRLALGLSIWLLAYLIALVLPGYNDSLSLSAIFIVGAFTVVSLINSSLLALMQSQMKMEFSLISVVTGKLVNIAMISLCLIYIFTDLSQSSIAFLWVFIAGLCGVIVNTYMNYLYAKRIVPIRFLFDFDYIAHIFKISLPYGLALFLSVVYFKIDIILLSLLEAPDMANISIALYGLPMKIIEVLMVLGGFYLNSILPSLSKKFTENKVSDISQMLGLSLKILISFALLIFLLGNLFSYELIGFIATSEYIYPTLHSFNAPLALSISLGVLLFHFTALAFIYILIASERQGILLWINAGVTLVNIIGNIILIPHYSFIGAAIITLLSQFILMLISCYIVTKTYKIPAIYIRAVVKTLLLGIGLFIIFYSQKNILYSSGVLSVLFTSFIFTSLYLAGEYGLSRNLLKKIN